jgi:hypothetical protein
MMNPLLGRILRLGPPARDVFVSAVGCFVMTRGFRLVVTDEGPKTASPHSVDETSRERRAGIGAALFLLAFIASEAQLTLDAFRR